MRREKKERKKKEKKNNEFSGHYVCHAARLQRRTGSAFTSLGPKGTNCWGEFRILACADTGSEDPPLRAPILFILFHILLLHVTNSNMSRQTFANIVIQHALCI